MFDHGAMLRIVNRNGSSLTTADREHSNWCSTACTGAISMASCYAYLPQSSCVLQLAHVLRWTQKSTISKSQPSV